jgi:hypothetical protein
MADKRKRTSAYRERDYRAWLYRAKPTEGFEPSTLA